MCFNTSTADYKPSPWGGISRPDAHIALQARNICKYVYVYRNVIFTENKNGVIFRDILACLFIVL